MGVQILLDPHQNLYNEIVFSIGMRKKSDYILPILRIFIGWIFLWAFLDKLLGLNFATSSDKSWLLGNSPTTGFLINATKGPFAEFFQSLANIQLVDWLFMSGLLLIGISLILGISTNLATYSGTLMLLLMWLAVLPPEHNPILDEHIIYALLLIVINKTKAHYTIGYGRQWEKTKIVKQYKFLK